ncbi:MAG TPA: chromate transporter [Stellaceae bacterium]|nr:chromate transporter [Stellaceae bacterium]
MSSAPRAEPPAPARVSLLAVLGVFAKIGLMSFGGALSGWMHREIVVRRRWMDEADFLSGLALGQIMPGANVANLSLYIGQRLRGGIGAVVALVGMLLPPMIVVVVLGVLYGRVAGILWLHRFIDGVAAAAIGLTILVGIRASRRVERRLGPLTILLLLFLTVGVLRWPMVPVVICVTPASVALAWLAEQRRDA